MGSARRRSAANAAAAGSVLMTIIAALALAGLSIYALLFMFDTAEKQAISVCGGLAILAGFEILSPFGRKTVTMLILLQAAVMPLLLHWLGWHPTSVPAPAVFALVLCAVLLAGLIGGLITGAMVFGRGPSGKTSDLRS